MIQYRYCIDRVSILYRYNIDTVSIQYRYSIDTLSILKRYSTHTETILYRYCIDIVPKVYRYCIDKISIQYRYNIDTVSRLYRYCKIMFWLAKSRIVGKLICLVKSVYPYLKESADSWKTIFNMYFLQNPTWSPSWLANSKDCEKQLFWSIPYIFISRDMPFGDKTMSNMFFIHKPILSS